MTYDIPRAEIEAANYGRGADHIEARSRWAVIDGSPADFGVLSGHRTEAAAIRALRSAFRGGRGRIHLARIV